MLADDFNAAVDYWIMALQAYSFSQLCSKPPGKSWSAGQLYQHLVDDTHYYIEQIKICAGTGEHANEEAAAFAKQLLLNNAFPDVQIEGAPGNALIPQPESKETLLNAMQQLKDEMNRAVKLLAADSRGKTKHPGLGYFSASEWLQFASIHLHHHLRQKKRIDDFISANKIK